MVFYRKYRSQTIDQLDSTAVREKLLAVLQKDPPHAFLFTGPKGLGKTSTARIIAKSVNCTANHVLSSESSVLSSSVEPCNNCEQCISITSGTNVDILEIDAASNRGIDEIRDLKEKIRLSPVSAKVKVYIIDEVHMLTTEAFNALLKTLEEPPEHAMFILCTTEPQKVPSTILSRCFHIAFQPATTEELIRSFKRIVTAENIDITDEALQYIAQLSGRGFRDGVKILEEITVTSQDKTITKELIETTFKTTNTAVNVHEFLLALQTKDVKKSLSIIKELTDQGTDIKYFITDVLDTLHRILLFHVGITDEHKAIVSKYKYSLLEVQYLSALVTRAFQEMKFAVLPQLPLELAVLEYCTEIAAPPSRADAGASPVMSDPGVSVTSLRKQLGSMKRHKALYGEPKKTDEVEVPVIETTTVELMHTSGDGDATKEWLEAFWKSLLDEMKKHNHTVAGVLRGCTIKSYSKNELVIQTAYAFHKERLDEMKNRDALLSICKLLTGNDMEIRVELKK